MTRVPFGAKSSLFSLAATLRHHLPTTGNYPETRRTVEASLYVVNLITETVSEGEGEQFYRQTLHVLKRAGMNIQKWNSNSTKLQKLFDNEGTESVHLAFSLWPALELLDENRDMQRFGLQASARICDPFMHLAVVTRASRLIVQFLWKLGVDWDAPLPEGFQSI